MQCKICKREGCQIVWHQIASNEVKDEADSRIHRPKARGVDGKVGRGGGEVDNRQPSDQVGVAKNRGRARQSEDGIDADRRSGLAHVGEDGKKATKGPSKQRWARKAYNAYQRDLMRKRRASKREKVLGDGGGSVKVGPESK